MYCAYRNTGREFFTLSRKQIKKIGRGKRKEKYNDTIKEDKSSEGSLLSLSQIPTKSLHCLPFLPMKPNDFSVTMIKRGTESRWAHNLPKLPQPHASLTNHQGRRRYGGKRKGGVKRRSRRLTRFPAPTVQKPLQRSTRTSPTPRGGRTSSPSAWNGICDRSRSTAAASATVPILLAPATGSAVSS